MICTASYPGTDGVSKESEQQKSLLCNNCRCRWQRGQDRFPVHLVIKSRRVDATYRLKVSSAEEKTRRVFNELDEHFKYNDTQINYESNISIRAETRLFQSRRQKNFGIPLVGARVFLALTLVLVLISIGHCISRWSFCLCSKLIRKG